jgi:hypothetical protein
VIINLAKKDSVLLSVCSSLAIGDYVTYEKILMNMRRIYMPLFILLLVGCNTSEDGWIELFNGENMDGWHTYGPADSNDGWYVENEELTFDFQRRTESGSSNLVTDNAYTNFELSIEWKISEQGNSGIFWGVVESEEFEHPYQTGPEIQILDDNWKEYVEGRGDKNRAGSLYGMQAPSTIVSKGAGIWNHYLIHIDHVENIGFVVFNDQEVLRFPVHGPEWDAMIANSGFAGWPDFGSAEAGHISLQDHGGKVAFRNIKVKIL